MKYAATFLFASPLLLLGCAEGSGTVTGGGGNGTTTSSTSSSTSSESSGSTSTSTSSSSTTTTTTTSSGTGGAPTMPAPFGCVDDVSAGHHLVKSCNGGDISYDVEIPAACAQGGCGLVLDMHGYTMDASQEDAGTGMRALGQQHGYVVVQPTAPLTWGWVQSTDVPAVFAFVNDVAAALVTDPKRAHVMGFSQGGGMTWRMICDHADYWASAAPISALAGCDWTSTSHPSRELPIMHVHGFYDALLNYYVYGTAQRDAALAYFWANDAGAVFASDTGYEATRYLSPSGTPYEFWRHDYMALNTTYLGHCFPGGSDVGYTLMQFGCADKNTFLVGEKVMDFFVANPMP